MDLAVIGVWSKVTFPQLWPHSEQRNLLKELIYMDTYNEELSCAVNVTEAGRQARAELKIMEKESS